MTSNTETTTHRAEAMGTAPMWRPLLQMASPLMLAIWHAHMRPAQSALRGMTGFCRAARTATIDGDETDVAGLTTLGGLLLFPQVGPARTEVGTTHDGTGCSELAG